MDAVHRTEIDRRFVFYRIIAILSYIKIIKIIIKDIVFFVYKILTL